MELSSQGETADALIAVAAWNGHRVERSQLAFWHRADLLLHPEVRRLGKTHGTESVYPPGTAKQLLALCEIHRHHKRTADIGWRLWLQGYPIPIGRIRAYLVARARWMDEVRGLAVDEDVLFTAAETKPLPASGLGTISRHVGRENFPAVVRVLMKVAEGGFEGFEHDEDRRIAEEALGTKAYGGNLDETLALMSKVLRTPLQAHARVATDAELVETREEFRSIVTMFGSFGEAVGPVLGAQGFGFRLLARAIRSLRPKDEAAVFTLWLAMRRDPEVRKGYADVVLGNAKEWDRAYRASLVIEELRREVPAMAQVLAPERILRPGSFEAIAAMRREHADAIDTFFAERPDALALVEGILRDAESSTDTEDE